MPKIMHNGKNYSMGNGGEVDSALSLTSENPVQNKIVTEALENKLNIGDIADWAKADEKPVYTASEVGADIQGAADTALSSAKSYTDTKISDLVNGAPETLDTLKEIADAMSNNNDVVEALDTAVGSKANASDLTAHINDKNNPHSVTKTQIGLGNVENKSSATIRGELTKENITNALGYTPPENDTKYTLPISTSTVLGGVKTGNNITNTNGTISITKSDVTNALGYTPPTANTTYGAATQSADGLMSSADKKKLDGIASGANKYIHPTHVAKSSGLYKVTIDEEGHVSATTAVTKADITALGIPAQDTNTTYNNATQSAAGLESAADKTKLDGIETGANKYSLPAASSTVRGGVKIGYTANGKNYPVQLSNEQMYVNVPWTDNNTTYSAFKGATASAAGGAGLVPAPTAGNQAKYLRADGTWQTPPDTNTTYLSATTSANGLMSKDDKAKLDGIATGAQVNSITGVKGNAESSYRTGNVNITPTNIGAVPISGTTMKGALVGQANADYTTAQFRNITMSTSAPSGGSNGQVHFQYS